MIRKYACQFCKQEFEDIQYCLITDLNGSKFFIACKDCIEKEKQVEKRRIRVFDGQEIRRSFE